MSDAGARDERRVAIERIAGLAHTPSTVARTGELLGDVAELGGGALRRLRAHHEILAPGRRSSSPHRHTTRDELVIVLRGRPSAWIEGELVELPEGTVVSFGAGSSARHAIVNAGSEDAKILVVSNEDGSDEVLYAPVPPYSGG